MVNNQINLVHVSIENMTSIMREVVATELQKVKELKITVHYDNNKDVVNQLPEIGRLFT